jgi:hypothetical protein
LKMARDLIVLEVISTEISRRFETQKPTRVKQSMCLFNTTLAALCSQEHRAP